jgi:hypothetical protein
MMPLFWTLCVAAILTGSIYRLGKFLRRVAVRILNHILGGL